MIQQLSETIAQLLGIGVEPRHFTLLQVCARGVVVFLAALAIVRFASKRFFARKTAFDVILGFLLASLLARAINGSGPLFQSIGAGFVIVGLHWGFGWIGCRVPWFGWLIKGEDEVLILDGEVLSANLRKHHLSERDLLEDMRLNASIESPEAVKIARLERNGELSVIHRNHN